jgi:DNA repair protein RecO
MVRKDRGVVLRAARSGDTSKLVTFLGRDSGKIKLIGKGALSSRSPFRGSLEAGNRLEVVFYFKEGRTLYFIKEAHVVSTLGAGNATLDRVAANLAALDLVDQVCYWGNPETGIVDLVDDYLDCRTGDDPLAVLLALEMRLLEALGSAPHIGSCVECGSPAQGGYYYPADGTSRCRKHAASAPQRLRVDDTLVDLAAFMSESKFDEVARTGVDAATRKRLGKLLHWTYTFHIQGYRLPEALKLITKSRHH